MITPVSFVSDGESKVICLVLIVNSAWPKSESVTLDMEKIGIVLKL